MTVHVHYIGEMPRISAPPVWTVGGTSQGDQPAYTLVSTDGVKCEVTLPKSLTEAELIATATRDAALMNEAHERIARREGCWA